MSTSPSFLVVNPAHLLDRFVADNGARWRLQGEPVHPPQADASMGASVRPAAGPTYLVVADAAGVANPFSGAGIEYTVETGVLAGGVLDEALRTGQAASLQRYPKLIDERYGTYFKVGRLVDRVLGRPTLAGTRRRRGRRPTHVRPLADPCQRQLVAGPAPRRDRFHCTRLGAAVERGRPRRVDGAARSVLHGPSSPNFRTSRRGGRRLQEPRRGLPQGLHDGRVVQAVEALAGRIRRTPRRWR